MLATYRLLLNSARSVMDKRLPLHVQKARLTNSHNKAAITFMVAKLDQLEEIYSPHKAYADGEKPVCGLSPAKQVDVLGPGQERQVNERSFAPPYPEVDWDNVARLSIVRGNLGLTLPRPTNLPVLACAPAPDQSLPPAATYNPMGGDYTRPIDEKPVAPFGRITGFITNLGPVAFPRCPIKGYIWDRENSWVLYASHRSLRRRGSRGSRR